MEQERYTKTFVTRDEYNKDIKRIDIKNQKQDDEILSHENRIANIESSIEVLTPLSDKVTEIRESQIETNTLLKTTILKMENMYLQFENHEKRLGKQENVGNVNLLKFFSEHFFKVLGVIVALYILIVDFFTK